MFGHLGGGEDGIADGDVLVEGEHQQAAHAVTEGEDEGRDEHDRDEEAVLQRGHREAREQQRRVVVHPQEGAADDVADGQVDQQHVVHGAVRADAHHRQQRQHVEHDAAARQDGVGEEAAAVDGVHHVDHAAVPPRRAVAVEAGIARSGRLAGIAAGVGAQQGTSGRCEVNQQGYVGDVLIEAAGEIVEDIEDDGGITGSVVGHVVQWTWCHHHATNATITEPIMSSTATSWFLIYSIVNILLPFFAICF